MKQVILAGDHRCAVVEKPEPRVRGEFAKVKILVAPMCTEYKSYQNGASDDCLGHEAAGEVAECGSRCKLAPGQRVVVMPTYPCGRCELCQAGDYIHCEHGLDPLAECDSETGTATYAQYCIKQDWLLLPIPDDISTEHASMACCGLGPSFGAVRAMRLEGGETVLITGMGPVGLGAVINATSRNAKVIAIEGSSYRAQKALELGAWKVVNPADPDALKIVKSLTRGRGADKAIECCAVPAAQRFAIEATRRKGHVCFIGWGGHIELNNIVPDGLTLQGCWHWNLRHAPEMFRTIRNNASKLDRLITHRFGINRVADAFQQQATGECGKVLLMPWK